MLTILEVTIEIKLVPKFKVKILLSLFLSFFCLCSFLPFFLSLFLPFFPNSFLPSSIHLSVRPSLPDFLFSFPFIFLFCFCFGFVIHRKKFNGFPQNSIYFPQAWVSSMPYIHGVARKNKNIMFEIPFPHDHILCIIWYIKIWLEWPSRVTQPLT